MFVAATKRGRILACNNAFETIFGYREVEIVGESIEKLVPERLRPGHEHHRHEYLKSPVARPMGKGIAMNLIGLTKVR
jgi:PAS domain S-box-containing protein